MRKQIIGSTPPAASGLSPGELNIEELATVMVTSEADGHPIDNAFDPRRGPGGSRWMAAQPGEQRVILAFDTPQSIDWITLEVEELQTARHQEIQLEVSYDGGQQYQQLLRQEYNFSPPGTTFQREEWKVAVRDVTHLSVRISPDRQGGPGRASLTSLVLKHR